jgi:hypothetical protein
MRKPEISVTCVFTEEGDSVRQILLRCFGFFLQRELARKDLISQVPAPFHAS